MKKRLKAFLTSKIGIALEVMLAIALCFYIACINYTEAYEVGLCWNMANGEISLQDKGGFHFTPPWVFVSRIDTRPMRVCITSASRTLNCRLVQFEPSQYREFVRVEGWHYYWWANRISFNWGYAEEYRGMRDIMRGYAYNVKQYPFIIITKDYSAEGP